METLKLPAKERKDTGTSTNPTNYVSEQSDRPKLKARVRKPVDVYSGHAEDKILSEISTKLKGLKLEALPDQLKQPLGTLEQLPKSPDTTFSIGTFTPSTSKKPSLFTSATKSRKPRSSKTTKSGLQPAYAFPLYSIKLTPTTSVSVVSPEKRFKLKSERKCLHAKIQASELPVTSRSKQETVQDEANKKDSPSILKYRLFFFHTGKKMKKTKRFFSSLSAKTALTNTLYTQTIDTDQLPPFSPNTVTSEMEINDTHSIDGVSTETKSDKPLEMKPQPTDVDGITVPVPKEANVLDFSQCNEIRVIDELINRFENFCIDHCLFFYPRPMMGKPLVHLVEQKFNPDSVRSPVYKTLLHLAASFGYLATVKHLVEKHKAKVDSTDCCGRTPLMQALDSPAIVGYLLNAGANVNHCDESGMTPLISLVKSPVAKKEVILLLLRAGANPFACDIHGECVFYHALVASNRVIVQMLFEMVTIFPQSRIGQFTSLGKPFFTSLQSLNPALLSLNFYVKLPDNLKLSVLYLNAVAQVEFDDQCYSEVYIRLKDVLRRKADMKVSIDYPLALQILEGRKEAQTVEELEKIYSSGESPSIEIAFQSLIIVERIMGHASFNAIHHLKCIINRKLLQIDGMVPDEKEKALLPYLTYFFQMLKHRVEMVGPEVKLCTIFKFAMKLLQNFSLKREHLTKLCCVFVETLLTYFKKLSKLHIHKGSIEYSEMSYLHWFEFVLNVCDKELAYKFITNSPRHPYIPNLVKNAVINKTHEDKIDKLLELGAAELLDRPVTDGYILHKAVRDRQLLKKLLAYGAHPDVADSNGKEPYVLDVPRMPLRNAAITNSPFSLYCSTAKFIGSHKFPYRDLNLPKHVVRFISLHDRFTHQRLKMEENGFVHHGFTIQENVDN